MKKFGFVGEGGSIEFENLANGGYGSVMDSSIKIGTIKPDSRLLVGKMNTFPLRFRSFPAENSVQ
ncbi:MAG: hypothetical protein NTV04_18285, partial [Deltaproteobacteria bacterium]|nr:hypothetical protein [Deltaproteobacteria bacterium]